MTAPRALVIGGTSGVGLATARRLHARGVQVHVAGRGLERLDALATTDADLIAHRLDAGDAAAVRELAERIGPLDHLVVTLSGSGGTGALAELDLDALRTAFEEKFWAQLTAIQAVVPHLTADGSVTVVGAITARAGMPGTAGIAAVNGAVEALVAPLAVELAPIRVTAVSPGFIDTPWWSAMPDDAREEFFRSAAAALPAGHVADADEVAEVVVLAATNPNITGTVIETDGGAHLVSMA